MLVLFDLIIGNVFVFELFFLYFKKIVIYVIYILLLLYKFVLENKYVNGVNESFYKRVLVI